jgi:hypothetical protein
MAMLPQINHDALTKKQRHFLSVYPSFIGGFPSFDKKSNKSVEKCK